MRTGRAGKFYVSCRVAILFPFLSACAMAACGGYRITVPITNADLSEFGGGESVVRELRKLDAERVLLSCGKYRTDPAERSATMSNLRRNVAFLHGAGFEVGVWNWTFLHDGGDGFVGTAAADGQRIQDTACALDPAFRKMAADYIADFARSGVDLILFDDDFCYGTRHEDALVCTCRLHMNRIQEALGEEITPVELQGCAMSGGRNRYRDAWRRTNRDALMSFAAEMRSAVDAVDPKVRLGLCAVMSLWDDDGVDAVTVSRVLAGRTRPFLRLIGAPYWAALRCYRGHRLQNIIELERAERSWCGEGIEVVGEGDVYPRPRTACPAAYLELFDMALRADGRMDGLMKYAMDYTSPVGYEPGYVERHVRNKPVYVAIERLFATKPAAGVRVYHARDKIASVVIPKEIEGTTKMLSMFSSAAGQMLADAGIPTVYDGEGMCSAAFGEDIRYVPDQGFANGIIIDAWAARILTEKGLDVGVRAFGEKVRVECESFGNERLKVRIPPMDAYRLTLDPKADVDSVFSVDGTNSIPAAYTYENAAGSRFLVLAYDGYFNENGKGRCYARSRQFERAIGRISGRKVPAYVYGNPDLYTMAKKDGGTMSVGLWNLCVDDVREPVVELDDDYRTIEFINCRGRLEGARVVLSEIPPFAFAGFEVRK